MKYASLWVEHRNRLRERLELQAGLRVDVGMPVLRNGTVRPSPRLMARYHLDSATTVSAAVGRSFQYAQTTWRSDRLLYAQLLPVRLWLIADATTPALRTDIASLGAERWLSGSTLLTVAAYRRYGGGISIPDPHPGPLVDRPLFVSTRERVAGVEAGIRRLSGRLTGSLSYAVGKATLESGGLSFESPNVRRRNLDGTVNLRVTRAWRVGAAFTAASGAPFTRLHEGQEDEDPDGNWSWSVVPRAESPSGQMGDGIRSLDLQTDWDLRVHRIRLTMFAQVQNALGRSRNSSLYLGYEPCTPPPGGSGGDLGGCVAGDEFTPGLPRLPIIGFRLSF